MGKLYLYKMEKRMQIKAYTLIEMCLVLSLISGFLLLVPNMFVSPSILSFEMNRMLEVIQRTKAIAIKDRRTIHVEIQNHAFIVDEERYVLDARMECEPYSFFFNEKGNISMANSVTCTYQNEKKDLIMNLGNGNVYVK